MSRYKVDNTVFTRSAGLFNDRFLNRFDYKLQLTDSLRSHTISTSWDNTQICKLCKKKNKTKRNKQSEYTRLARTALLNIDIQYSKIKSICVALAEHFNNPYKINDVRGAQKYRMAPREPETGLNAIIIHINIRAQSHTCVACSVQ